MQLAGQLRVHFHSQIRPVSQSEPAQCPLTQPRIRMQYISCSLVSILHAYKIAHLLYRMLRISQFGFATMTQAIDSGIVVVYTAEFIIQHDVIPEWE